MSAAGSADYRRADEACDHDDDALILEGYDHVLVSERWTCTSCGAEVRYVAGRRVREEADRG